MSDYVPLIKMFDGDPRGYPGGVPRELTGNQPVPQIQNFHNLELSAPFQGTKYFTHLNLWIASVIAPTLGAWDDQGGEDVTAAVVAFNRLGLTANQELNRKALDVPFALGVSAGFLHDAYDLTLHRLSALENEAVQPKEAVYRTALSDYTSSVVQWRTDLDSNVKKLDIQLKGYDDKSAGKAYKLTLEDSGRIGSFLDEFIKAELEDLLKMYAQRGNTINSIRNITDQLLVAMIEDKARVPHGTLKLGGGLAVYPRLLNDLFFSPKFSSELSTMAARNRKLTLEGIDANVGVLRTEFEERSKQADAGGVGQISGQSHGRVLDFPGAGTDGLFPMNGRPPLSPKVLDGSEDVTLRLPVSETMDPDKHNKYFYQDTSWDVYYNAYQQGTWIGLDRSAGPPRDRRGTN